MSIQYWNSVVDNWSISKNGMKLERNTIAPSYMVMLHNAPINKWLMALFLENAFLVFTCFRVVYPQ